MRAEKVRDIDRTTGDTTQTGAGPPAVLVPWGDIRTLGVDHNATCFILQPEGFRAFTLVDGLPAMFVALPGGRVFLDLVAEPDAGQAGKLGNDRRAVHELAQAFKFHVTLRGGTDLGGGGVFDKADMTDMAPGAP